MTSVMTIMGLAARFGINESNLARRRAFIKLGEEERRLLIRLIPWIRANSAAIAHEFYDWQFSFPGTRAFFERFCQKRGESLEGLRERLELEQAKYLEEIFLGAQNGWGIDYIENRLNIGMIHNRIDLPFKWYIGSYVEWSALIRARLEKDYGRKKGGWRRGSDSRALDVGAAAGAIDKVFNLDMQAVGDSFLLSLLESMGFSVDAFACDRESDRTERLGEGKRCLETILRQAEAIAQGRLNDEALETAAPGTLGRSFETMAHELSLFMRNVGESAQKLSSASKGLSQISREMDHNARESTVMADSVAKVSGQVSENAQSVADSVDGLAGSIGEIAANAQEASEVAHRAVDTVSSSKVVIGELGKSSGEIGEVIGAISAIAQQTNLLSLNAAIEAARAGEAGKGFGVVATEVKELARETEAATEKISQKVETIQDFVAQAVEAIDEIGKVIESIHEIQSSIAVAVAQQNATTREIGDKMRHLVDFAAKSHGMSAAVKRSSAEAGRVRDAAEEMARMSQGLQSLIGRFAI